MYMYTGVQLLRLTHFMRREVSKVLHSVMNYIDY